MVIDLLIIGAGPVGLFATFQAGIMGLNYRIVDSNDIVGGQCIKLYPEKYIYDIPGISKVLAKDLINNLYTQANLFDLSSRLMLNMQVVSIKKKSYQGHDVFSIQLNDVTNNKKRDIIFAKTILVTSGSGVIEHNKITLSEAKFFEDISLFYKVLSPMTFANKTVAIFGGGDSAIDWTKQLSHSSSKIFLVHRRNTFTSFLSSSDIANESKIQILTPYVLLNIEGSHATGEIESIVIQNIDDKKIMKIECSHILAFFGLKSKQSISAEDSLFNHNGLLDVSNITMESKSNNIFAAGDCCSYINKPRLILSGFHEATVAIRVIYERVFGHKTTIKHSTDLLK